MLIQRSKESSSSVFLRGGRGPVYTHPCFNKCANQPRPDRTLMINRISCARVALIVRRVSRFAGSERTQTDRRKQKHFHRIDNPTRFLFRQKHERQSADGEDLVRPKCKINYTGLMIAINHVSEDSQRVRSRTCFRMPNVLFRKVFPNARRISHRRRVR